MSRLDKIRQDRLDKVAHLQAQGIDAYPSFSQPISELGSLGPQMGNQVHVAGRVTAIRGHGKLIFMDLQDQTGKVQLMCKQDALSLESQELTDKLDVGDFIAANGEVTNSKTGELSILVSELQLLTKSLRPLPEKWHGLTDIEERYRQRYVDLLVNPEVRKVFETRSRVVSFLRNYLDQHGFIEVETPIMQPIYGGTTAKPFTTQHNALDSQFYLRISDELYLKRLVVGGFEKVYEIGKDFRNEGMSREHNPEFTMLEFYWAYTDYEKLMEFTETMLSELINQVTGSLIISYQGEQFDFTPPWQRITFRDLLLQYLQIDIDHITTEEQLIAVIKERNLLPNQELVGYGKTLDLLYKKHIRPGLKGPLFLTDYPTDMVPLAKRKEDNPNRVATFQLVISGTEYLKAYNELNDPREQRARWEEEQRQADAGADEYQPLDHDYIRALEYGMPPTAGWGLGIDRFVAFLTDQPTLKDVILFPTLRPEVYSTETESEEPEA